MAKNCNKRELKKGDPLEVAYADLKASIENALCENSKHRRGAQQVEKPRVYKVVSRGDDSWVR